jgi:hypothetical protein
MDANAKHHIDSAIAQLRAAKDTESILEIIDCLDTARLELVAAKAIIYGEKYKG